VIIQNIIGSHLNPTAYGYTRWRRAEETKVSSDATTPLPPYNFAKKTEQGGRTSVLKKIDSAEIRDLTNR